MKNEIEENIDNTNENSKNKRIIYFDVLNILACINVVLIHMNGIVHSFRPTIDWKTALIFEVICYWAVPVFVMLSGATLLKYRERYNTKANGYIMFLILGYLLSTTDISKKKRIIIYILGVLSAIIRYFYTYHFSMKQGKVNKDLFDYTSALSVFLSLSVFLFIKNINLEKVLNKFHITPNFLATISSCSFGVYLMHLLVKNTLTDLFNLNPLNIIYRTIGAICLYVICVIIVLGIKKIPIVKNIVP